MHKGALVCVMCCIRKCALVQHTGTGIMPTAHIEACAGPERDGHCMYVLGPLCRHKQV